MGGRRWLKIKLPSPRVPYFLVPRVRRLVDSRQFNWCKAASEAIIRTRDRSYFANVPLRKIDSVISCGYRTRSQPGGGVFLVFLAVIVRVLESHAARFGEQREMLPRGCPTRYRGSASGGSRVRCARRSR